MILHVMTIVFVILKSFDKIDWNWWLVFSPSILVLIFSLSVLSLVFFGVLKGKVSYK